ncbi:MAG: cytochrome c biogenesis protein ResB [Lachnospiraceae bacterium]|nr:cytochrome c biogenesis protein ResB [Lachnospiraceae bacterium]
MKKPLWKRILSFLHSMKLAMILLGLIVLACLAGSMIVQGEISAYYESMYGVNIACLIQSLQLDQVFTCWWFVILVVTLCVNLLLCSVLRLGIVIKKCGQQTDFRCRISVWGPWLCHVGMLLLIAGFALGQNYSLESYMYGVPGETKHVEGTEYSIRINDFTIELREDDTVKQYTADLTVIHEVDGAEISGIAQVNHPMDAFGMRVYQNSTGWASQVDVYRDEVLEDSSLVCVGEALIPGSMPELALVFDKFYPDYVETEQGAMSKSSALNNPCAAFSLYYGNQRFASKVVSMDHKVIADPFWFVFHDPQPYTLIQVVYDPYMGIAAAGGALMLISLVICFYVRPQDMRKKKTGSSDTQIDKNEEKSV